MRYRLKFLQHYLFSNSRHGTHSPFVYALADQAIYVPALQSDRQLEYPHGFAALYQPVLDRILHYLKVERLSDDLQASEADAYWLGDLSLVNQELLYARLKEGKLLIVDRPHRKGQQEAWQRWIGDQQVIVSVDLFHFGLLLFRAGQRKENFQLRYPGK